MCDPGKIVSAQTYDDIQRVISSFSAMMANPEIIALLNDYVSKDEHGHIKISFNEQKPEKGEPDSSFEMTPENLNDVEYLRGRLEAIEVFLRIVVCNFIFKNRSEREALHTGLFPADHTIDPIETNPKRSQGYRDGHGSILAYKEMQESDEVPSHSQLQEEK